MSPTEYQQLVEFLGRQFAEVDRRFTEIDRRFTGRFDVLDGRVAGLDGRVTGLDGRITGLDDRLTELRQEILGHFDEVYRRLERLEQEYHAITQALRRIEAGLADERGRREILERDLAELKRHVAVLQSRIEEIEQRLGR
jgi:chromosome segregation ATPase